MASCSSQLEAVQNHVCLLQNHSLSTARQEKEHIFSHTEIAVVHNTFKTTLAGRRLGLKEII